MRRRTLLTSLAALTGIAGCVSEGPGPAGRPPASESPTGSPSPTDVHTRTTNGTPRPPSPSTDAFADFECTSFDGHADRTVCYHAADVAQADLLLTADPEVFDPDDGESLRFTLHNRSGWPVGCNPYAWGIERYDAGSWVHVAPGAHPEPWTTVPAGGRIRWELPSRARSSPSPDDAYPVSVALDAGVYAFHVTVSHEGAASETPTDRPKPDGRVALVALFRVEQAFDPTSDDGTAADPDRSVSDGG